MNQKSRIFTPFISGLLTTIGGVGLLIFSLEDKSYLRIVLASVILISGIMLLLQSKK